MKRLKIKTEHAGAKNGGGWWGSRQEAKDLARLVRRRIDRAVIESELEEIAMCGRADDPSTHDEEWALVLEEEGVLPEDPYLSDLAMMLDAQAARLRAERLEAALLADRDDPLIDYASEV